MKMHNYLNDTPLSKRFFLFGKKKSTVRKGAMTQDQVEKKIREFGVGKKVIVSRVDYEGRVSDETPIIITTIQSDHFAGKVVNVDRAIMEQQDSNAVYVKGGGGSIEFYYEDGDVASIEEDIDNEIIESMDNAEIREILDALEVGDEILLSYYDTNTGGIINGMGALDSKDLASDVFSAKLHTINEIKQSNDKIVELNLQKNKIVALQII
jgi:hypothetical protein